MQLLIIAGLIPQEPTLRRIQSGDPVLSFSVAVDNGKDQQGNRRNSTFYDCSLWGKRGEAMERVLKKGMRVTIQGRPSARENNGKAYLGCSVNEISIMHWGDTNQSQSQSHQRPLDNQGFGGSSGGFGGGMDSEIPFAPEWRI